METRSVTNLGSSFDNKGITNMDWIGLVAQLITLLLGGDRVDADSLIRILGNPTAKNDRLWRIQLSKERSETIREAFLFTEDLSVGRGVVTAIELDLVQPWRISPENLGNSLGCTPRQIPTEPAMLKPGISHSPRPRTFACDIVRGNKHAIAMFTGRPVEADPVSEIDVVEIVVSREYD